MKITCDREKLLSAFQTAATVVPARSPKPILQNVKLDVGPESATLMATDLELGIRMNLEGIEVQTAGSAVLPIGRFGSILRESSDERLFVEASSEGMLVKGARSEFRMPGENSDEFPAVTRFNEERYYELPVRLFHSLIRRTLFATDSESSRYALGGVLLEFSSERITAVGTDGRRLAKMEGPTRAVGSPETPETATIVPSRAMQLMDRAFSDADVDVQIAARANDILVRSPRATIYSRLVEGRFPKWRDVFPQRREAARIDLPVGPLHSAVRQAMILTSEESKGVDFSFSDGTLVLSGRAAEKGQSRVELPVPYQGSPLVISLDPKYMSEFLRVLDEGQSFKLELTDAESAAVCTTEDGYGYVIMPLARDR